MNFDWKQKQKIKNEICCPSILEITDCQWGSIHTLNAIARNTDDKELYLFIQEIINDIHGKSFRGRSSNASVAS
jgi:hypothetical protein